MEYILLEEVSSTQDYIKERIISGEYNNIVMTKEQTLGRGRRDREWISPIGGLWFSFDVPFFNERITIKIGVCVREVLEEAYGVKVLLKWPNDLILNGKKVGGILCEKVDDRVIVGVGINTNIEKINIENSISFLSFVKKDINNEELMKKIVDRFFKLEDKNIVCKFRENMAFMGEEKFISALNREARIVGISDKGHLIIEDDVEEKEIFVGEILIDRN